MKIFMKNKNSMIVSYQLQGASFVDRFCYVCVMFVFDMLSCLFLVSLCSPAGKGLLCVVLSCILSLSQMVSRVRCGT